MKAEQITKKTYQKIAPEFAQRHFNSKFWLPEYRIFKKLIKGKKVLDVGCGPGRDAKFFVKNKFDYLGVDYSPAMIRVAKRRVPKGKFKVMDMTRLRFPEKSFDGFWAAASLLHIPKSKTSVVLKSFWKILKPGGIGFVSLKARENFHTGLTKLGGFKGLKRYFTYYNNNELKKLLRRTGFRILKFYSRRNNLGSDKIMWICIFVERI